AHMNHAVMDTSLFVRRPLFWMTRASTLGATQLCSPNFGFKHFLNMFLRKGADGIDLAAVRLIMNGAEPISYELCEQFLDALQPFGLKRTAMFPVYGLAEATVAVSFPEVGAEYSRIVVDRHSLRIGGRYEPAEEGDDQAFSCDKAGSALRDCLSRISFDDDPAWPSMVVGNIQVKGPNVTG